MALPHRLHSGGESGVEYERMAFLAGAGITEVNKDRACLMNDDGAHQSFRLR